MARILGVEIPDNKKVEIGIQYIYGVGQKTAQKVIEATGIDSGKKVKDLSEEELGRVVAFLQKSMNVEGDLRKEYSENIKRLTEIGCYRGLRHKYSLPARGQRTRTNARTRKGPKKTVGVIRDKAARKTAKQKPRDDKK